MGLHSALPLRASSSSSSWPSLSVGRKLFCFRGLVSCPTALCGSTGDGLLMLEGCPILRRFVEEACVRFRLPSPIFNGASIMCEVRLYVPHSSVKRREWGRKHRQKRPFGAVRSHCRRTFVRWIYSFVLSQITTKNKSLENASRRETKNSLKAGR